MIQVILQNNYHKKEITFPCREAEITNALIALQFGSEASPGVFIFQVEEPEELKVLENKFVDLDEINYLAKRMESFSGDVEFSQFYEALKHEGFTEMKDIINLTFNMNRYPLIQDISDVAKIGREYMLVTQGALPTGDLENPCYAEKGRELIQSGKGIFTEHGMLFVDEDTPFQELYDGEVFPFYLCDADYVLTVILEYNDKQELISLPCEEIAIYKASKRLKAPNIDSLTVKLEGAGFNDFEWMQRFEDILHEQGISAINRISQSISINKIDMKKFFALVDYAETDCAEEMIKIIENVDSFHYAENVTGLESVGRYFVQFEFDYSLNSELEQYFNFEAYGDDKHEEYEGAFIRGDYVCMVEGKELEEILGREQETTVQEM